MKFLTHDPDLHCCVCAEPFVAVFRDFGWCQTHLDRIKAIVHQAELPKAARRKQRRSTEQLYLRRRRAQSAAQERRAWLLGLLARHPNGIGAMEITQQVHMSMPTLTRELHQLRALGIAQRVLGPRVRRGQRRILWLLVAKEQVA